MENETKEITVIEQPKEIAEFGKRAAGVLQDIVKQANLVKTISGKNYMMFEGWQTVAKFFGSTVGIEWTKPVYDFEGTELCGFEAKAYVKDKNGNIISTAESYCGKDEKTWKDRPVFAIRSMAQTRASAKALRMVYSYVVVLAGYRATPAEEMDGIETEEKPTMKNIKTVESTINTEKLMCSVCKIPIVPKVYEYSISNYKKPLCFSHQKEIANKIAAETQYDDEHPIEIEDIEDIE